jgi:hypothetical protein
MLKKSINEANNFYDHVNAFLKVSNILKKVFSRIRGRCGASDYGPFSSIFAFFLSDQVE